MGGPLASRAADFGHVERTVRYADHALERMAERGIDRLDVERILAHPFTSGSAGGSSRWKSAPVQGSVRRDWLTVIFKPLPLGPVVETAYFGVIASHNSTSPVPRRPIT